LCVGEKSYTMEGGWWMQGMGFLSFSHPPVGTHIAI
jgi:hypothetical protein